MILIEIRDLELVIPIMKGGGVLFFFLLPALHSPAFRVRIEVTQGKKRRRRRSDPRLAFCQSNKLESQGTKELSTRYVRRKRKQ